MADLLQALAADVIAGVGISPSDSVSSHPDLLRRYNELGKIIQVWNTEGDKTAVRREANLIKAQLSYNKDVIGAQKALNKTASANQRNAVNALTKLEVAIGKNETKMSTARNAQSEYIMHRVRAVASRPSSRGAPARAWSALNGVLGEEGMIGRIPEPAIPLILQRMKNTYGTAGLGPDQRAFLTALEGRAKKARAAEVTARKQHHDSLAKVTDLKGRAAGADPAELGRIITEARGVSSNLAVFMEGEVGLKNKAELQARLENLQGQSDTLGRMEERHKQLDALLGRGGGSNSERQKLANMISHPRFRAWAESNGYEVNALGIADRSTDGSSAVLTSYVPGRDDLKAALHFQHQLRNPESYRSILSPFGQRSRSGKYVVVTDKVSAENAQRLSHKTGKHAGSWVTLDDGKGNARVINERQYQEHAQKYVAPSVFLLKIGEEKYAQSGGVYYKLLPTGKWAQQAEAPDDIATASKLGPLALADEGSYTRFATVTDLTEGGGKGLATRANQGNGLLPMASRTIGEAMQSVMKKGGEITEHGEPPVGMMTTYAGELVTQHAIDVRNSRGKAAVDVKVHGLNGIRTFSGDAPITIDVVQKDDDTGFGDVVEAYLGSRRAEIAIEAADEAPTNVVTTQSGQQTWNDRSNETNTVFSDAKQKIVSAARGDITEGPASEAVQAERDREKRALADVPERAAPVEGIRDITQDPEDPPEPGVSAETLDVTTDRPLVVPPPAGGPPMPEGTTSWTITSGPDAGVTATMQPNGDIKLAKGGDVVTIGAGSPEAQDLLAGAPGDVKGGRTYGRTQAARRASVAAHRRAQMTPDLGAGQVKDMPELDQLRAKYERALLASTEKPTDRDLKAAARTAKKTYEAAAGKQLKDRDELKRHAAGESIEQIQPPPPTPTAPPAPTPTPTPAARIAAQMLAEPTPVTRKSDTAREAVLVAARLVGEMEAVPKSQTEGTDEWLALQQAQRALKTAGEKYAGAFAADALEDTTYESGVVPHVIEEQPDFDAELVRLTERGISQGRDTYVQKLQAGQREREAAAPVPTPAVGAATTPMTLDPDVVQLIDDAVRKSLPVGRVDARDEPMPEEEDIGAKLRSFLGLGEKGQEAQTASVQERPDAPATLEVPGRQGLPPAPGVKPAPMRAEDPYEEDDDDE